ncbi:MAG TPA: DUF1800 domain-containing protein, partial [Candidatus Xenobia bacterium]
MQRRLRGLSGLFGVAATVASLWWMAVPHTAVAAPRPAPSALSDRQKTLHLLNRFAFGPRPTDLDRVMAMGRDRWFHTQLYPDQINDSTAEQRLTQLKSLHMEPVQLMAAFPQPGQLKKLEASGIQVNNAEIMGGPRDILVELGDQKLVLATESEHQLQEVMADFWENHFNVNWVKGLDRYLLTDYDQNVIRPHTLGKFKDLLEAVAHSPAMMVYLDNFVSTRNPDPNAPMPAGKRKASGLNENYARELMELHTLGVGSGYTQQDVQQLARVFTGIGVNFARAPRLPPQLRGLYLRDVREDGFEFNPARHDFGQVTLLGHTVRGAGFDEVRNAVTLIVRQSACARFVSRELATYFVADDPPPQLVAAMARTFQHTDGDIAAVLRTMFSSPQFTTSLGTKFKDPMRYVVSA